MPDYLETTVHKFTFRVATDRLYSREGVWVLAEGKRVRIGRSDSNSSCFRMTAVVKSQIVVEPAIEIVP